jgi:hypothetical protein
VHPHVLLRHVAGHMRMLSVTKAVGTTRYCYTADARSVGCMQALENTLVQLVGVNSAFSHTFKKVDTTSSTQERLDIR